MHRVSTRSMLRNVFLAWIVIAVVLLKEKETVLHILGARLDSSASYIFLWLGGLFLVHKICLFYSWGIAVIGLERYLGICGPNYNIYRASGGVDIFRWSSTITFILLIGLFWTTFQLRTDPLGYLHLRNPWLFLLGLLISSPILSWSLTRVVYPLRKQETAQEVIKWQRVG
jgi:hypothetical protein